MSLMTETVTVLTATVTGRDDYGNDIIEWIGVESRAWLENMTSTENTDDREQTTANMRMFAPLSTAISHTSRVRWDGYEWDVSGEPGRQPGGFLVPAYQVVMLTRTEG